MTEIEFSLLPKQIEYLESTADTAIFQGGVGAAKTVADVCLAIDYAFRYPGIDILMTAPTYGNLKDTIIREFQDHCPQELIDRQVWGIYPEIRFIQHKGKHSRVRFRAFDKPWKPKGITVGLWIGGEMTETSEKSHNELRRRVRQRGMPNHKRFSTNPDSKGHWFYKRYIEPWEKDENKDENVHVIHTESFDNYLLPDNYVADLRRMEKNLPGEYKRMVLGLWGDFDVDIIGAFEEIEKFTAEYLVAWFDTSYSDSTRSDNTSLSIVGFTPMRGAQQSYWPIEFTGMSWQKSISHPDVINEAVLFLDRFKPIEAVLESQLAESTQVFIDRFRQAEVDMRVSIRNTWGWEHQKSSFGSKHERIMLYVGGNRDRIRVLKGTDKRYLHSIINYKKKTKEHDDEPDSLAGAIYRWQTSPVLKSLIISMAG